MYLTIVDEDSELRLLKGLSRDEQARWNRRARNELVIQSYYVVKWFILAFGVEGIEDNVWKIG